MAGKGQNAEADSAAKAALERNEQLYLALKGQEGVKAGEYDLRLDIFHETCEPLARSTGWHVHEQWHELSLMREGSMEYKIKDKLVSISAVKGDVVFIPAGMKHCRSCLEPGSIVSGFQFALGAERGSAKAKRFDQAIEEAGFHGSGNAMLSAAFARLREELETGRPLKELRLNLLIKELLAQMLLASIPEAFKQEAPKRPAHEASGRLAHRLEAYIEENLSREISLHELGDACGVSPRHANRIFSKRFGMPLGRHITQLRMKAAKAELEAGGRQVKEVAGALGYRDVSHFIRLYKKAFGHTPKERWKSPAEPKA